jgi:hypothetical protein
MDRTVRKIDSTPPRGQQDELRPFSAYEEVLNIVLLGDPGAGKTHTFRESAAQCGCRFVTARTFLVSPATKFDGTLFIDGLDEKRAGRSDRDTVDNLVEKLFAVEPRRVRISCRAADWLGDSDLAALRPYFEQSGDPIVLQLSRLSADEQSMVLQAEGLSTDEADAFLREATERALDDFLENPQNLIMLQRAVRTGTWPATRKELFQLSTQLMLEEFDKNHARSGSGVYTVEELRPAAGAACAARLISDIEAIGLADHEESTSVPSYRSLSMVAPEKTLAVLGRRVFVAGPVPESVDYTHRTTAEYLGAVWLANAVRNGMPFGRLQALMGIGGHPAPELRGLHAWLAVHLPEHADSLIDGDPYGVLTYGDAASLTQSSCAHLVKALGRLSQTDPWFRAGNWRSPAVAALSRTDMADEFRTVLRSNNAVFGVRSIVVEAMALGAPVPALKDDLADVVLRSQFPYVERFCALIALLRIGPDGEATAGTVFQKLEMEMDGFRLRAEMIHRMYGERFGPADITVLLKDLVANTTGEAITGVLHTLSEHMPLNDIPVVLDKLPKYDQATQKSRRDHWEISHFIARILLRALLGITDIEPARALQWLRLRDPYVIGDGGGQSDLRAAILGRQQLLSAITEHFFDTLVVDNDRWLRLARFRHVTLGAVVPAKLLGYARTHMLRSPIGSEKELFLYQAAFGMAFSMDGPEAVAAFEELFTLGDIRDDLRKVRDVSVALEIPGVHLERPPRNQMERSPDELRKKFEQEAEAIRNGLHLGWLSWAAQVYFGLFYRSDQQASPRERLAALLGDTNTAIAIEGFIAALSRPDVPLLTQVVDLSAKHRRYDWWYALTAGLVESDPSLTVFSDEFLRAMLAFDLTNPVFQQVDGSPRVVVHNWKAALIQDRPELVRDAYVAIANAKFAKGEQIVDGLRELMVDDAFRGSRVAIALQFLRDFPNAYQFQLNELFGGVLATPAAHSDFLVLANGVLERCP